MKKILPIIVALSCALSLHAADLTTSANVDTLLGSANFTAFSLNLFGADPGADRILFWDDSAGAFTYLTLGTGLSITTTTLAVNEAANFTWTGAHDFSAGTVTLPPFTDFTLPSAAGSSTLTSGQIALNTTDKQIGVHNGTREVALPLVYHREFSFDPKAVCDGAVDRLFLFKVGAWAPKGILITGWRVSFEADPTTEADLDLKRADAFIGVANAAVMDVLDTTTGVASEATAANINSGAVVANGKVIYLEFGTAYTETTHQIIFEIEYEIEED